MPTGSAYADSLAVDINTGVFVLSPDSVQGRLHLQFGLPQELSGATVVFAELRVPVVSVIPDSSALMLQCNPLAISWNPDEVTWDNLGDSLTPEIISEDGTVFATSATGEQEAYFDITNIVRGWQDSSLANNGMLLYCEGGSQPSFQLPQGGNEALARVKFTYTH